MKERLENKIIELIKLLDAMAIGHRFSSYNKVKNNYSKLLELIKIKNQDEITEEDFDIIQNCIRMVLEAPQKDYLSGINVLNKMQEIYDIQTELLN